MFLNTTKEEAFEDVNVPFNSLVFVATQLGQRQFLLKEVHRVAPHLPLVTRPVGTWDSAAGGLTWAREATRTGELHGLTIKAAMNHVSNFAPPASLTSWIFPFISVTSSFSKLSRPHSLHSPNLDFP